MQFVVLSFRKMTTLFRPWTEDNFGKSEIQSFSGMFSDSVIQSDSVILLAKNKADEYELNDCNDRENRYKSVKEHMKKRSEKYILKKLKVQKEKKEKEETLEAASQPEYFKCSEITSPFYPTTTCYYPAATAAAAAADFHNSFDYSLTKKFEASCAGPTLTYPQDVDTILSHSFTSTLFEEYAKFLTEQQKQVTDRNRKQRPKKFRCPHCQVGFSNNGQLKGHIRIHTGERPFKCDAESCGKSFTRNEELTRHRRIHSGLRPFPCSECGKRFGRKDHLKKHVKTHFQQRYQLVPIMPSHCHYFFG